MAPTGALTFMERASWPKWKQKCLSRASDQILSRFSRRLKLSHRQGFLFLLVVVRQNPLCGRRRVADALRNINRLGLISIPFRRRLIVVLAQHVVEHVLQDDSISVGGFLGRRFWFVSRRRHEAKQK